MLNREQALEILITHLNNLKINYKTDYYIIEPDVAAILADIYIPSMKLGININNIVDVSPDIDSHIAKNTAQWRAMTAKHAGCAIIQMLAQDFKHGNIWPYLRDHITAHAQTRNVIGARECKIKQLSAKERNIFLNTWHAQGAISRAQKTLALIYNKEIVALIAIGPTRYTDSGIEILRYCTRPDIAVTGGFNKLLKHACDITNHTEQIISYADLNWNLRATTIYDELFQMCGLTPPDYRWANPYTGDIKSRYQCMKHKLVAQGANPNMTERQIMHKQGYVRVFGAGSIRYILNQQ